ncbi:MAG TPA: LacI family transcriptional regulator [Clostridiales bacterium]|nr:LacI family transcriptional regulator [Clostridiales bacterium]
MINVREIAEKAGVSPSTVSNVLNGKKNVSAQTRETIIALCNELGYSHAAKTRHSRDNKTIAFIFSDFDRSFYLEIIKGINQCLTENGYDLIICTNTSSSQFMKEKYTIGAICLDEKMTNEQLNITANEHYPVVVMDRILHHEYIKSVIVDNYPVMKELVLALIKKGYRRFGYLGGIEETLDNIERFKAFQNALDESGIQFNKRFHLHGDYREKSGYQAAHMMLLSGNMPQILVCASDNMAIGAMRALKDHGYIVPRDIAVTGFDNISAAASVGLTTISIPRYENGYLAAKELLAMITEEQFGGPIKLRATIKWRETTV